MNTARRTFGAVVAAGALAAIATFLPRQSADSTALTVFAGMSTFA